MTKNTTKTTKQGKAIYNHVIDGAVAYSYLDGRPGEPEPERWARVFRQTVERFDPEAVNDLMTAFEEFAETREHAAAEGRDPAELEGGPFLPNLTDDEIRDGLKLLRALASMIRMDSFATSIGITTTHHHRRSRKTTKVVPPLLRARIGHDGPEARGE